MWLEDRVAKMRYRPPGGGETWKFSVMRWANHSAAFSIEANTTDSSGHGRRQLQPTWAFPSKWISTVTGSDRMEAELDQWCFVRVCEYVRHEAGERFESDRARPFYPRHSQPWVTREYDEVFVAAQRILPHVADRPWLYDQDATMREMVMRAVNEGGL